MDPGESTPLPVLLGIPGEAKLVGDMHLLSSSKLRRGTPRIDGLGGSKPQGSFLLLDFCCGGYFEKPKKVKIDGY